MCDLCRADEFVSTIGDLLRVKMLLGIVYRESPSGGNLHFVVEDQNTEDEYLHRAADIVGENSVGVSQEANAAEDRLVDILMRTPEWERDELIWLAKCLLANTCNAIGGM